MTEGVLRYRKRFCSGERAPGVGTGGGALWFWKVEARLPFDRPVPSFCVVQRAAANPRVACLIYNLSTTRSRLTGSMPHI